MPWDRATFLDIVVAAREIVAAVEGADLDAFLGDVRLQALVLHRLIVIGEAAKRLSPEVRARHSDVP